MFRSTSLPCKVAACLLTMLVSHATAQDVIVIHDQTPGGSEWSLPQQLGTLLPEQGSLTVVHASEELSEETLDAAHLVIRFESLPSVEGPRNWHRLPEITVTDQLFAAPVLADVFGEEIADSTAIADESDDSLTRAITVSFQEGDVPLSRRNAWSRQLVAGSLLELGMIDEQPTIDAWLPTASGPIFGVYDAEGTGGEGVPRIARIVGGMGENAALMQLCAEDVRAGALDGDRFHGVLFPGGGGGTQGTALGEEGRAKLTAYIERGGGYIGICAGAYLATCRLDNYLCLVGSYHHSPWRKGSGMVAVELSETGQHILGEEFTHFESRFQNGLLFEHEDGLVPEGVFDEIEVWAYYRSAVENPDGELSAEMIDSPAIVASTHGAGRLLLISPHPETHPELDPMMERAFLWTIGRE